MIEKLYGIDTWSDLDDYGVSYILRELYRTREAAEKVSNELRSTDGNLRYYARVVEFKVVDA